MPALCLMAVVLSMPALYEKAYTKSIPALIHCIINNVQGYPHEVLNLLV